MQKTVGKKICIVSEVYVSISDVDVSARRKKQKKIYEQMNIQEIICNYRQEKEKGRESERLSIKLMCPSISILLLFLLHFSPPTNLI